MEFLQNFARFVLNFRAGSFSFYFFDETMNVTSRSSLVPLLLQGEEEPRFRHFMAGDGGQGGSLGAGFSRVFLRVF